MIVASLKSRRQRVCLRHTPYRSGGTRFIRGATINRDKKLIVFVIAIGDISASTLLQLSVEGREWSDRAKRLTWVSIAGRLVALARIFHP